MAANFQFKSSLIDYTYDGQGYNYTITTNDWITLDVDIITFGQFISLMSDVYSGGILVINKHKLLDKFEIEIAENTGSSGGQTINPSYNGISLLTGEQFTSSGLQDTLDKIIRITYLAPTISIAGSSNIVREKGDTVSSITLTATIAKKSNDISEVRFYQGATLLDTQTSGGAIASGGQSTYVYSTSFDDNISFSSQVDDALDGGNQTIGTASSTSYVFVYPYYVGADVAGLLDTEIVLLEKVVQTAKISYTKVFTADAGDVFYIAYPDTISPLTSILDVNSFETISSWTQTVVALSCLDGSTQQYKVYTFNNPVAAGDYQYTFKR